MNRIAITFFMALSIFMVGCPDKRPGTTDVFVKMAKRDRARAASRPTSRSTSRPQSRPTKGGGPVAPFANKNKGPVEADQEIPLNIQGHNSVTQLKKDMVSLPAEAQKVYDQAFRLTFAAKRQQRQPFQARRLFQSLIDRFPKFGPAYRGMGYTFIDAGFDYKNAIKWYKQSVTVDPNYGVGHYGLAFILGAMGQTSDGFQHFQNAMKQGVQDERGLKGKYYKHMGKGIAPH